jgi:hypothetical protein
MSKKIEHVVDMSIEYAVHCLEQYDEYLKPGIILVKRNNAHYMDECIDRHFTEHPPPNNILQPIMIIQHIAYAIFATTLIMPYHCVYKWIFTMFAILILASVIETREKM